VTDTTSRTNTTNRGPVQHEVGSGRGGPSGWWPYRAASTPAALGSEVELTAVPYYAWANRDPGAMRVWIPTI
jgi:DUF1680 family protein